jgi:hypothetical protein
MMNILSICHLRAWSQSLANDIGLVIGNFSTGKEFSVTSQEKACFLTSLLGFGDQFRMQLIFHSNSDSDFPASFQQSLSLTNLDSMVTLLLEREKETNVFIVAVVICRFCHLNHVQVSDVRFLQSLSVMPNAIAATMSNIPTSNQTEFKSRKEDLAPVFHTD